MAWIFGLPSVWLGSLGKEFANGLTLVLQLRQWPQEARSHQLLGAKWAPRALLTSLIVVFGIVGDWALTSTCFGNAAKDPLVFLVLVILLSLVSGGQCRVQSREGPCSRFVAGWCESKLRFGRCITLDGLQETSSTKDRWPLKAFVACRCGRPAGWGTVQLRSALFCFCKHS